MSSGANVPSSDSGNSSGEWFGHPPQLARLFITEMWERFGYYGMRAILSLYLAQYFLFSDKVTGGLYGAFTSLVYLTPMFGGLLADRYLGSKRAVKFGAILMSIGYLLLCFGGAKATPIMRLDGNTYDVAVTQGVDGAKETRSVTLDNIPYSIAGQADGSLILTASDGAQKPVAKGTFEFDGQRDSNRVALMFLALSCVIVGNGFFKPNISTMVGSLYAQGDRRRDSGFTIFYMGINLGSMISTLACPFLQDKIGFWAGFAAAAVGMFCSFLLITFDQRKLDGIGEPNNSGTDRSLFIYIGALLAIPLVWFLLNNTMQSAAAAKEAAEAGTGIVGYLMGLDILGKVLFVLFTLAVIGIPIWAAIAGTVEEAQKMFVAVVLIVFSVVFWTLFEQAGSSLTFFADRNTDRNVFGNVIPAGAMQTFNALFIVILAPVFSWIWFALAKRNLEPSIPVKFAIALALVGLGFLVLVYGSRFANDKFQVALIWLALAYLIHSIGELCLSPVGLSMITKLSIARVVGLMMGVWFLSSSMAQYVGGIVAQFAAVETVGGEVTNPQLALQTYTSVFATIGYWSIGFGVLLLVLSPLLKKMMHGVK